MASSDDGVNKLITGALSFTLPGSYEPAANDVRSEALRTIPKCVHVKKAFRPLLAIAVKDTPEHRVIAIHILIDIADVDNTPTIKKTLEGIRFDANQNVRAEVEKALDKLGK
jgi:hypothetical protein